MRVEHPHAGDGPGTPPAYVDVRGEHREVDADGTFEGGDETWLQQFARRYGTEPDALVYEEDEPPDDTDAPDDAGDAETCTTVKNDGDVCGRELPCPYHSDDED